MKKIIRTSQHTLKFANKNKLEILHNFINDYKIMVQKYINIIFNNNKINGNLLSSKICNSIKTNRENDSRIRQCAAKQACSIMNSITTKPNKLLYKLKELQKENKNTKYLQRKISLTKKTKPKLNNFSVELDSRFVDIQETNGIFNIFIQIKQIGNKEVIKIPIKHTKVSQKFLKEGKLLKSIRIKKDNINLYFEINPQENSKNEKVIGIDQGLLTAVSMSDGQTTKKDKHGHDLNSIIEALSRKKKGSKSFKRKQSHRNNYINWSINTLNFNNVKEIRLEKIYNLRKGKRNNRKMSHWSYSLIKKKFVMLCELKGFKFVEQDNKFRSQRCNSCGFTHKSNRLGKTFKCKHCEHVADSDLNAASNHETNLCEVPEEVWYNHINRSTGFFWLESGTYDYNYEPIVRNVQENVIS